VRDPTEDEVSPTAARAAHIEAGGQTMGPSGLTVGSCRVGASNSTNGISSPTDMEEEDADDDLLDYEPFLCMTV
jgi:hypothetical protein